MSGVKRIHEDTFFGQNLIFYKKSFMTNLVRSDCFGNIHKIMCAKLINLMNEERFSIQGNK